MYSDRDLLLICCRWCFERKIKIVEKIYYLHRIVDDSAAKNHALEKGPIRVNERGLVKLTYKLEFEIEDASLAVPFHWAAAGSKANSKF